MRASTPAPQAPHGTATSTRERQGEIVGLHITPGRMGPVFLTTPGHVRGEVRMLARTSGPARQSRRS